MTPSGDDGLSCGRCRRPFSAPALDRLLWCDECVATARATAGRAGWLAGTALAAAFALWVALVEQPPRIVIGGWVGAILATWWLGGRIGRELCFGLLRFRGRPR